MSIHSNNYLLHLFVYISCPFLLAVIFLERCIGIRLLRDFILCNALSGNGYGCKAIADNKLLGNSQCGREMCMSTMTSDL